MIRAILEGRKTQTRRVVNPQPDGRLDHEPREVAEFYGTGTDIKTNRAWFVTRDAKHNPVCSFRAGKDSIGGDYACQYGSVGTRLWVRETWAAHEYYDCRKPISIPDGVTIECLESPHGVITEGDGHRPIESGERGKWRPSIFMPRWASRMTLEITEVRVERVQEISEADAMAEGVASNGREADKGRQFQDYNRKSEFCSFISARSSFRSLWDSINAKRGFGWNVNPWVWAITFKKL